MSQSCNAAGYVNLAARCYGDGGCLVRISPSKDEYIEDDDV